MLVKIENLLSQSQIEQVQSLIDSGEFKDGKLTAGYGAKSIKNNLELDTASSLNSQLNHIVMNALVSHPIYKHAAWPKKVAAPFYAKYEPGMEYGDHVDDPVMGHNGDLYRSDVSTTVFLNDPTEYVGGELCIIDTFGTQKIKLAAGSAVVYPSSSRHYVAPVSEGIRIVAVTWTQSAIKSAEQRELLYEMNEARNSLLQKDPQDKTTKQVSACFNNLVRMWADI